MKLAWDQQGDRHYETGVDRGVLYIQGVGVTWNGLVNVKESLDGSEIGPTYIDGTKVGSGGRDEDFAFSIEAYTYPDEFALCDGTAEIIDGVFVDQQPPKSFDFSYRTMLGSDLSPDGHYKIHLVYSALTVPTDKEYLSFSESVDPSTFNWDAATTPPEQIPGYRASAHLIVDTRFIPNPKLLSEFEDILYGTATTPPTMPSPAEVAEWFGDWWLVRITDNGDGTWTATGPDEYFSTPGPNQFQINYESAVYLDDHTYTIQSL